MNPFDFFSEIFCINLDYREDRWKQCQEEFDKLGILKRVIRISGIEVRDNPSFGNHLSHALCVDIAETKKAINCLIFEDDVKFINSPLSILELAINQLPKDWRLFYLGVNTERPCYQISPNIAKLTFAYSTHAYAINKPIFNSIKQINENYEIVHNDVAYTNIIIPNYSCYSTIPLIAIQRESYSDIEKKVTNYNWMEKRFEENLIRYEI